MNYKNLLLSLAGLILLGSTLFYGLFSNEPPKYTPRSVNTQMTGFGFNDAAEWYFNQKKNQITGIVDHRDILTARKMVEEMPRPKGSSSLATMKWGEVGPDNIAGRTRAIVIDKDNPNILYAAGVAGGIFKSVTAGSSWVILNDYAENLAVSCMAQCPVTGHIYAGTGEGLASPRANPNGGTAFIGRGIYKSTDGENFSLLSSAMTAVDNNNTSAEWATVNEIVVDEQGWVYAATNRGLRLSKDGGASWDNPLAPVILTADDVNVVKVGNNKTVVASVGNRCYISSTGDGNYENHSTGQPGKLPGGGLSRIEFAIAPSNPDYIYALAARTNGNLHNVYRSTDKGETWDIIGIGGTTIFEPLRGQGWYNNTIAVFPNNPNKVIIGGIDIWSWELGGNWTQRTLWYLEETNPYYVHADIHRFVFHPNDPNTFYVGSDGGVSRSIDGGMTYQTINKNFNTAQFYAIAASASGEVMGGTQDNGTIYISRHGNTPMNGKVVKGGDGGYTAFSFINQDVFFATTYYAGLGRSINKGQTFFPSPDGSNQFFNARMLALGDPGNTFPAAFVTPFLLWESFNDILSPDSVLFEAADTSVTYNAGDVVKVNSSNSYLFDYVLPTNLNHGDVIKVQDIIQSRFYLGINNAVWMTRKSLDFSIQPHWYEIGKINGQAQTMSISKCGNYMFIGTHNGNIYRMSNLRYANDSITGDVSSPFNVVETKLLTNGLPANRWPGSIAIDPNDANHVIVTYGNYGNQVYVYRSTNALSESPTFSSRQGNLPKMPVYASMIEMNNSSIVIIGTEYGAYATDNINSPQPIWVDVNNGLANVPIYMIRQQVFDYPGVSNYGVIYAGTHGRGAFESGTFMSVNQSQDKPVAIRQDIRVYPNPATEKVNISFTLSSSQKAQLNVYDMRGRIVNSFEIQNTVAGLNTFTFNCSNYTKGTYIVNVLAGNQRLSTKFIVY